MRTMQEIQSCSRVLKCPPKYQQQVCCLCVTGHSGIQEEAEATEDPHAGWDSEDCHGGRLQDCQRHAHDHMC